MVSVVTKRSRKRQKQ